jgi:hypothetical protein
MRAADNKLVSIQEFLKDWSVKNGGKGPCAASILPTTDRRIAVSAGASEPLQIESGPDPISNTERERIAEFLRKTFGLPTPKYLCHYKGLSLRIEQIGPDLWGCSCYDNEGRSFHPWISVWTSLYKHVAQHEAGAAARNYLIDRRELTPDAPVPLQEWKEWQDLSDMPDANWDSALRRLGFPKTGYVGYPDIERFAKRDVVHR